MWSSDNTGLAVMSENWFKCMGIYESADLICDDLDCPKVLRSRFRQLLISLIQEYGYPRVGTSRVAFAVNSESIIKVAWSKRGLSQNISECSLSGESLIKVLTDSYRLNSIKANQVVGDVSPLPTVVETKYRVDLIDQYDLLPDSVIEQEQVSVIEDILFEDSESNYMFWSNVEEILDGAQVGRAKDGSVKFYDY